MKLITNGTPHELTADEMTVLHLALKHFNEFCLPLCSEEREQQYLDALKHLQKITTEQANQNCPVSDAQRHFNQTTEGENNNG